MALTAEGAHDIFMKEIQPLVNLAAESVAGGDVQPESWLGTPYNEIMPDDTFNISLILTTFTVFGNFGAGLAVGFMLIVIVVTAQLTTTFAGRLVNQMVTMYQESLVTFLCVMIAIGRWADNLLFLKRYNE